MGVIGHGWGQGWDREPGTPPPRPHAGLCDSPVTSRPRVDARDLRLTPRPRGPHADPATPCVLTPSDPTPPPAVTPPHPRPSPSPPRCRRRPRAGSAPRTRGRRSARCGRGGRTGRAGRGGPGSCGRGRGRAGSPRVVTSPRDIVAVGVTGSPTPKPKHGGRGQEGCGLGAGVKASTGSVGGVIMDGDVSQ